MRTTEIIKQFIAKELLSNADASTLGDMDSLIESGIVDSYGIMSLIAFIENEFDIRLVSEELMPEYFENVNAIAGLVDSKSQKPGSTK